MARSTDGLSEGVGLVVLASNVDALYGSGCATVPSKESISSIELLFVAFAVMAVAAYGSSSCVQEYTQPQFEARLHILHL